MHDPSVNPEAELDAALRQTPYIQPAAHFRNRLLARLPEVLEDRPRRRWAPAVISALLGLIPAGGASAVLRFQLSAWLVHPHVLASVLGFEIVASLAWLWRISTAPR